MKKRLLLLSGLVALTTNYSLFAQNYLGVHSSNYAGVMGLNLQPASFVDGRFVVDVNLVSVSANVWNNAMAFDTKGMPGWWAYSFQKNTGWMSPDSTFQDRHVKDLYKVGQKKTLGAYQNMQIDVLNFAFHITPKIALGFGLKGRMVSNVDDATPELVKLMSHGLDYSSLWNNNFNNQNLNVSSLAWKEYFFNYGQVVMDKDRHFLKAGATFKLTQGMGSAYMYSKNMSYGLSDKDHSYHLQGDFNYGYSDNLNDFEGMDFKKLLLGSASKAGFGLDLGVVYEFRPKYQDYKYEMDGKKNLWRKDQEKYLARVGLSVLDIGSLRFTKGGLSRDFSVNSNSPFDLRVFKDVKGFKDFDNAIDSLVMTSPDWNDNEDVGQTYRHTLPTAISIQGDFKIWKDFYVNVTGLFNLISKRNEDRVRVANTISITPSYDFKWFGLHIPMSYNDFQGFRAGLGARLGPITAGFVDWGSMVAKGKVRGTGFYLGLRVPVLYGRPKDRDGDKVSDKMDDCPDSPGVWAFRGCPDRDGDGVQDKDDECPDTPGLPQFKGCPDTDGDGIPDKDDACPNEAGSAALKGCPDRDGDGIADKDDACPDEAGLPEFNGCPDTDGDGIPDKDDKCPTLAGPASSNGCPDTDGDGIFDDVDQCPDVAGPAENNGCPWPDTDGDGVLDKDDKCPNTPGPASNKGCPYDDLDGDGVPDKDDDCPNTPGPASNRGCPEIDQEVKEILQTAFDDLEFETGKDIIKDASKPSLDKLAEVMLKRQDWKLQIAGHTDNVGKPQSNLLLSRKRAEAVKNYLTAKGIDEKRFSVLYFGQTKPIAPNTTPEGRQKNRRVEMTVIFE